MVLEHEEMIKNSVTMFTSIQREESFVLELFQVAKAVDPVFGLFAAIIVLNFIFRHKNTSGWKFVAQLVVIYPIVYTACYKILLAYGEIHGHVCHLNVLTPLIITLCCFNIICAVFTICYDLYRCDNFFLIASFAVFFACNTEIYSQRNAVHISDICSVWGRTDSFDEVVEFFYSPAFAYHGFTSATFVLFNNSLKNISDDTILQKIRKSSGLRDILSILTFPMCFGFAASSVFIFPYDIPLMQERMQRSLEFYTLIGIINAFYKIIEHLRHNDVDKEQ
jgi:hypothetical protein